jgi:ATP-binding cassette subfamily B (MDR/TAP) protein 1
MRERSFQIFFGLLGVIGSTMLGFVTMFWGFGHASERMNKRVRDAVFANILRQEVAWFDAMPPATLISRLSDDAAMLHSFVGEPIRTLVASLASVLVAIIVAFVYMW